MITCPKCGYGECKKDGIVKSRQRYKCKPCGYRHTVQHIGKSSTVSDRHLNFTSKALAFELSDGFLIAVMLLFTIG